MTREEIALLELRAARVRDAPPREPREGELLQLAEFPLGDESWALPLASLRAAVPLRSVTPVPLAPAHVIGILRWQGQLVCALSLASLVGGRGFREDPAVLLVVEPRPGAMLAIDCERIPRPFAIPRVELSRPVTVALAADGREVHVVDLARLVEARRA